MHLIAALIRINLEFYSKFTAEISLSLSGVPRNQNRIRRMITQSDNRIKSDYIRKRVIKYTDLRWIDRLVSSYLISVFCQC